MWPRWCTTIMYTMHSKGKVMSSSIISGHSLQRHHDENSWLALASRYASHADRGKAAQQMQPRSSQIRRSHRRSSLPRCWFWSSPIDHQPVVQVRNEHHESTQYEHRARRTQLRLGGLQPLLHLSLLRVEGLRPLLTLLRVQRWWLDVPACGSEHLISGVFPCTVRHQRGAFELHRRVCLRPLARRSRLAREMVRPGE